MPRGSETALIHPYPGRDNDGDLKPDLPTLTALGCIVLPRTTQAYAERGEIIIEGYTVFIPPGQPRPADGIDGAKAQMTVRGERFEIDGVPGHYVKGTRERGTLVTLKRLGT